MDLKIKDVAELLHVSETTIRRWLSAGRIPAYKLNHQYRFSRIEIENWMMSCKIKNSGMRLEPQGEQQIYPREDQEEESAVGGGMQHFSLFRALHKGDVLRGTEGKTKEEVIQKTMVSVAPKMGLDPAVLTDLLIDREHLMSTAINQGVAVPHARELVLSSPADFVSVVFLGEPLEYGALDGQPVHTLFFLFSSSDKRHLHLLSKIAHFCTQKGAVQFLKTRPTKEQLLTYVKTWESTICG